MAGAPFSRVAIVGLGAIGGSIGLAIRRAWPDVHRIGVDRIDVVEEALRRGAIDNWRVTVSALDDVDLIVLATPVLQIVEDLRQIGGFQRAAGISPVVTDVGSTKRRIVDVAAKAGVGTFVGGHPMAGGTGAGLAHARADLFDGCRWFLTTSGVISAETTPEVVSSFVIGLGARPHVTDAITHDRVMAYVSHAPQLLASALAAAAREAVGDDGLACGGRGFADMTRLAASAASVWRDILATNADFVREALDAITRTLPPDAAALANAAGVDRLFARANEARARLDARP